MKPPTEFESHRRRVELDRAAAGRQAKREIVLGLLEMADAFDRTLAYAAASPESAEAGLRAMRDLLRGVLDAEGVTPFESVGQPFDPERHEATATVADVDRAPGSVVDESGPGYFWKDGLLRPARVRVAR